MNVTTEDVEKVLRNVEDPVWTPVADSNTVICECPTWSQSDQMLYWADVFAPPALHRTDPRTGATTTFPLPERFGCYGLRPGGAVLALASGISELQFDTGKITRLFDAPFDTNVMHLNDGRTDLKGRLVVGTRQDPGLETLGLGFFYRVDAGGMTPILPGVSNANGIAFSPDGRTMYRAETRQRVIFACDYDASTGTASNERVFARLPEGHYPDGAAIDENGGYWIAIMETGKVLRFNPDGELDRIVKTPTSLPTMISFGGDDLRTVFLTTSRRHVEKMPVSGEVSAGGVFSCRMDIRGIPEPNISF